MLHYSHFQEKVSRSSKYAEAKNLPPTAAAMKYHTFRVFFFFQLELWKGNPGNLKPTEWGWKIVDGHMVAMQTDLLPAPKKLIQVFRCVCKTGCLYCKVYLQTAWTRLFSSLWGMQRTELFQCYEANTYG